MEVYLLLLLMGIVLGFIVKFMPFRENKQNIIYLSVYFVLMLLVACLRSESVGADTWKYLRYYNYCTEQEFSIIVDYANEPNVFEYGFVLLSRISAFLGLDNTMYLVLIASIIYIPTLIYIYKYSQNKILSIVLYNCLQFYGLSLSAFRQMIAISILLMAVKYILNRDKIRWILSVFMAMSFHLTAFCMMPFYWFNNTKINKKKLMYFIIGEILCVCLGPICSHYISSIPVLGIIFEMHIGYNSAFSLPDVVILLLINLIVFLMVTQTKMKKNTIESLSVYIVMAAALVIIASFFTGNIMKRFNMYYLIYLLVLLPNLLKDFLSLKMRVFATTICVLILTGYLYLHLSVPNDMQLVPYYFYWER